MSEKSSSNRLDNPLIFVYFLFTSEFDRPTTSKDENLPLKYYEAEMNGHLNLCDEKYKKCPVSIFDLITVVK